MHLTAQRRLIGQRDERSARAAAGALAHQVSDRASAIYNLSLQADASNDIKDVLVDAGFLLPEFDVGLAQFAPDGTLVQSTQQSDFWGGDLVKTSIENLKGSNEFPDRFRNLTLIADPTSGEKTLLAASSMADDSVIAGAITLDRLVEESLSNTFDPTEQASVFIMDDNYELLYSMGPTYWNENELVNHPGLAQALDGQSGAAYHSQSEKEHIVAYGPVAGVDWALVIEEPWQLVADPVLEATELVPLVLIPALIIAMFAIWIGYREIVRPLQNLENLTSNLAFGRYDAIEKPVGGISEIQNLQSELIRMVGRLNKAQRDLRDYLGSVTIAQEEERRRLARDLHDDTIQSLVALTRKAQLTRLSLAGNPEVGQLADMEEMIIQIIEDLRRISRDLRPVILDELGLTPALKMLVQESGSAINIPVTFSVTGNERRLPEDVELALFRISQEALSNIARHAQASHGEVHLTFDPGAVVLTVTDDGRGFDVPESPIDIVSEGHYGLLGLFERADMVGGYLTIQSETNQGTRITITIPKLTLPAKEDE
jgi:signal transduction histidine kinase